MVGTDNSGKKAGAPDNSARFMKAVVIFLGVLLIAGFVVLFSTIIYRMVKVADDRGTAAKPGAIAESSVAVPVGARVRSMVLDGNRLAVHLQGEAGEEIVVIDVRRAETISRVRLVPEGENATGQ